MPPKDERDEDTVTTLEVVQLEELDDGELRPDLPDLREPEADTSDD